MGRPRTIIPGSTMPQRARALLTRAPDDAQTLSVSVVIRRPPATPTPGKSREEIENLLSASVSDIEAVTNFATEYQLRTVEISAPRRTIRLEGTVAQLEAAFGTTLQDETDPTGESYLTYYGQLTVPADLDGIVVAVLGLDNSPIARPGS